MITERQQELAGLYSLGALTPGEAGAFKEELAGNGDLAALTRDLQATIALVAVTTPAVSLPRGLKAKVFGRIDRLQADKAADNTPPAAHPGLIFAKAASQSEWKPLPIPGASIKLLSLDQERGYAVLLGKLAPGTRYPAHRNEGPESFYILNGDLVVGEHRLAAGDFHHAEAGSQHGENYSEEGCTLIAVLTTNDPLVALALA